jgi:hypothetical protein
MPELGSGVITALFERLAAEVEIRTAVGLEAVAVAVERQAKINASSGAHRRGTPTPAHPGTGPATISRTLVDSVTHTTPVMHGFDWMCRVGPQSGKYAPYDHRHRTPSSEYGGYLERGLKNGTTYPWLEPAAHIAELVAPVLMKAAFGGGWR